MPAGADALPCDDPLISVEASDDDLRARLCTMTSDLRTSMTECGLSQKSPITIEVVPALNQPFGDCLASYNCADNVIQITDPASFPDALLSGTPYAALPPQVTLRALLTHELAHALATQTAGGDVLARVDQEYIAAALELDLMAPEWRAEYLRLAPVGLPPRLGLIDALIYALSPRKFAVNAWQHFRLPENGCPLIRQVVAGETSFADTGVSAFPQ